MRGAWLTAGAAMLLAVACGGGKGGVPDAGSGGPGLGESTAAPTGTAFVPPAGVSVVSLSGAACAAGVPQMGLGPGYVDLCGKVNTIDGGVAQLTLPGGLIVISDAIDTQNGLFIITRTAAVDGGGQVQFRFFCLNASRHGAGANSTFRLGPVTDNAGLKEIVQILQGKTLGSPTAVDVIQSAVWNVTDFGGLTDQDRKDLRALP